MRCHADRLALSTFTSTSTVLPRSERVEQPVGIDAGNLEDPPASPGNLLQIYKKPALVSVL